MIIDSHVVQLGFDDSRVRQGVRGVKKLLERTNNLKEKGVGLSRKSSNATSRETKELLLQNRLNSSKNTLRRRINRADELGIVLAKEYRNALSTSAASAKSIASIREKSLAIEKMIINAQKQQKALATSTPKKRVEGEDLRGINLSGERLRARRDSISTKADDGVENINKALNRLDVPDQARKELIKLREELKRLKAQVSKTSNTMELRELEKAIRRNGMAAREAVTGLKAFNRQMLNQKFAVDRLKNSLFNLASTYLSVFAVIQGAASFFRTGLNMDAMRASLLAASGDAETAADNFRFLREESKRLGQPLQEGLRGFNRMGVAARSMGLSVDESREIFSATQEAATAFSMDAQRSGLVMLAFSQMMSKGRVSMEEMSRQLGENLPVAWEAAERAMGKSRGEIMKMIESGKLLSEDFVLPFARSLREIVRESNALQEGMKKVRAEQNRFFNENEKMIDKSFQEGKGGFISFFRDMSESITELEPAYRLLGRAFGAFAGTVGFTVKILSPVISLLSRSLLFIAEAFERAFDPDIDASELNAIEKTLRVLGGVARVVKGLLLGLAGVFQLLGDQWDQLPRWVKQLIALGVTLFGFGKFLKPLTFIFNKLAKALAKIKSLLSFIRGKGFIKGATEVGINAEKAEKVAKVTQALGGIVTAGGVGAGLVTGPEQVDNSTRNEVSNVNNTSRSSSTTNTVSNNNSRRSSDRRRFNNSRTNTLNDSSTNTSIRNNSSNMTRRSQRIANRIDNNNFSNSNSVLNNNSLENSLSQVSNHNSANNISNTNSRNSNSISSNNFSSNNSTHSFINNSREIAQQEENRIISRENRFNNIQNVINRNIEMRETANDSTTNLDNRSSSFRTSSVAENIVNHDRSRSSVVGDTNIDIRVDASGADAEQVATAIERKLMSSLAVSVV